MLNLHAKILPEGPLWIPRAGYFNGWKILGIRNVNITICSTMFDIVSYLLSLFLEDHQCGKMKWLIMAMRLYRNQSGCQIKQVCWNIVGVSIHIRVFRTGVDAWEVVVSTFLIDLASSMENFGRNGCLEGRSFNVLRHFSIQIRFRSNCQPDPQESWSPKTHKLQRKYLPACNSRFQSDRTSDILLD